MQKSLRSTACGSMRSSQSGPGGRRGSAVLASALLAASAWLAPATAGAAASAISVVYSFAGDTDGKFPEEALVEHDEVLYGTTFNGGNPGDCGTVFGLTLAGAKTFTYAMESLTGCNPKALAVGADGMLYGTTELFGGVGTMGTAFRITTAGVFDTKLANFLTSGPSYPEAGLVAARSDGSFYGTTSQVNGAAAGTVFRLTPDDNLIPPAAVTHLHTFSSIAPGLSPRTALIEDADTDGVFYGTTASGGGVVNAGTVFRITSDQDYLLLHSFSSNGEVPAGPLVQGPDGMLYGTTVGGGANGQGAVFKVGTDATGYQRLHSFSAASDGLSAPRGGLVLADDGKLYGTAGGIFRIDPDTGQMTRLLSTAQVNSVLGVNIVNSPNVPTLSGLIQGSDGDLYGTASFGGDIACAGAGGVGTVGCGAVFKVTVGDDGVDIDGSDNGGNGNGNGNSNSGDGGGGAMAPGLLGLLVLAAALRRRSGAARSIPA